MVDSEVVTLAIQGMGSVFCQICHWMITSPRSSYRGQKRTMVLVMSKTPLGFFNHNLAGFGDVYTNAFSSLRGISRFLLTPLGIRRSPSTAATYWSDTHGRCAPTTEGTFSHSNFWKQAKCIQGGGHFALQKGRSFISIYMHLQNAGHLKHLFAFVFGAHFCANFFFKFSFG